jgi:NAD(P)-dependent dehydrogenase (short-subunit alcohol dehydrogenase family)
MKKRTLLILGASGLIGGGLFKKFSNKDYDILGCDLKRNKANNGTFYKTDASKENDLKKLIKKIDKKYRNIDVVINAIYPSQAKIKKSFFKQSKEDFLLKVNFHLGINFLINKIFINYFLRKKIKGNIIHISSIYGSFIPRFEIYKNQKFTMPLDYLVAKSSVDYCTKYLSKMLLGSRIVINNVSPGGIFDKHNKNFVRAYSKFTNNKSMLKVDDIFGVINFLASLQNSKITGQNFIVDDGFSL